MATRANKEEKKEEKAKPHNKVVLKVGYKQYIVDAGAAFAFISALTECEEYETVWDAEAKTSNPIISPMVDMSAFGISGISPEWYAMGKMIYKASQLKKEQ